MDFLASVSIVGYLDGHVRLHPHSVTNRAGNPQTAERRFCRWSTMSRRNWRQQSWLRRSWGPTLLATALTPDAYVKLVEIKRQQSRDDRKGIAACCIGTAFNVFAQPLRGREFASRAALVGCAVNSMA
jgi:hypothetical protein